MTKGTIIWHDGRYYYSPSHWHNPVDGLKAQPDKWYGVTRNEMPDIPEHVWPQYPDEYVILKDFDNA